jgi:hypothetical protein
MDSDLIVLTAEVAAKLGVAQGQALAILKASRIPRRRISRYGRGAFLWSQSGVQQLLAALGADIEQSVAELGGTGGQDAEARA